MDNKRLGPKQKELIKALNKGGQVVSMEFIDGKPNYGIYNGPDVEKRVFQRLIKRGFFYVVSVDVDNHPYQWQLKKIDEDTKHD